MTVRGVPSSVTWSSNLIRYTNTTVPATERYVQLNVRKIQIRIYHKKNLYDIVKGLNDKTYLIRCKYF